jgi:endogenous inhibitor of DNA gyrase (YacG/DUF329 family)
MIQETEDILMSEVRIVCPICKKETVWEGNPFRPFCSERCRVADLGKWASDEYRITGEKKTTSDKKAEEK